MKLNFNLINIFAILISFGFAGCNQYSATVTGLSKKTPVIPKAVVNDTPGIKISPGQKSLTGLTVRANVGITPTKRNMQGETVSAQISFSRSGGAR